MDVNILEEKCRQQGKVLFMSNKGRYSCRMSEEDKKAKRTAASKKRTDAINWEERCRALGKIHHVSPTGRKSCRKSKSPTDGKRAPSKYNTYMKGWMSNHPKKPGQTQQDRVRSCASDWKALKEATEEELEYPRSNKGKERVEYEYKYVYRVILNLSFKSKDGDNKSPPGLEDRIKKIDPMEYVEYLFSDSKVLDARWTKGKFGIMIMVQSNSSKKDLKYDLIETSLEDGEYSSRDDNGWTIKAPNGDEIGLVDYRRNAITIEDFTN
jgi:hypothetical protein